MIIQFERRFFRYKDEVGKFVADMLRNGGSWDFTVAVVEDTEDKPGGFEVTAEPKCVEWKETMIVQGDNLDGKDYVVCVPDGTVNLVSWGDLSIERSQKRTNATRI